MVEEAEEEAGLAIWDSGGGRLGQHGGREGITGQANILSGSRIVMEDPPPWVKLLEVIPGAG